MTVESWRQVDRVRGLLIVGESQRTQLVGLNRPGRKYPELNRIRRQNDLLEKQAVAQFLATLEPTHVRNVSLAAATYPPSHSIQAQTLLQIAWCEFWNERSKAPCQYDTHRKP